jgi:hypothetical protein
VGATVVLLHHKGKSQFGPGGAHSSPYRGSSEIAGACDIGHGLTKVTEGVGQLLTFKTWKNRYEEEREVKFVFDKNRRLFLATEVPIMSYDEQLVLRLLKASPGMRYRELQLKTGFGENKIRAILKEHLGKLWNAVGSGSAPVHYFPIS